jgi:hypothetical protein
MKQPKHEQRPAIKAIRDRTLRKQGFGIFSRSAIAACGKEVAFFYPSGARYIAPIEYVASWFDETRPDLNLLVALRSRKIAGGDLVRVYLSDGRYLDVAWDTVLMACEPRYEHYGGLTAASKALTKRWSKRLKSMK